MYTYMHMLMRDAGMYLYNVHVRSIRHTSCTKMLTFYMDIYEYVHHLKFSFPLTFSAKTLWVPPIVKFLLKTLWVPGPRGPGVPHPMTLSVSSHWSHNFLKTCSAERDMASCKGNSRCWAALRIVAACRSVSHSCVEQAVYFSLTSLCLSHEHIRVDAASLWLMKWWPLISVCSYRGCV